MRLIAANLPTEEHPKVMTNSADSNHLEMFTKGLRDWYTQPGILYHQNELQDELWLTVFEGCLQPIRAAFHMQVVPHYSLLWKLDIDEAEGLPHLQAGEEGDRIPLGAHDAMLPTHIAHIPIKTAILLYRQHVKRTWFFDDIGLRVLPTEDLLGEILLQRKVQPFTRRFVRRLRLDVPQAAQRVGNFLRNQRRQDCPMLPFVEDNGRSGIRAWRDPHVSNESLWMQMIQADNELLKAEPRPRRKSGTKPKVVQYIGSLNSGGAERQLCNLAIGLHQRGYDCQVWTTYPSEGGAGHGHYSHLLEAEGIESQAVTGEHLTPAVLRSLRWDLLATVPDCIRPHITRLAIELVHNPPDILHCWLDHPNIMGALAGIIANVPNILLSTRNSNPTNFPYLHSPYMDAWYRIIDSSDRVHWMANSHSGARSYAAYMDHPEDQTHVVLNGVFNGHFNRKPDESRREARKLFGISEDAPVISIVNRLSVEKQPELAMKVVHLVKQDFPDLVVLFAGAGPLEDSVKSLIARRRLGKTVRMLGRVQNVDDVMNASDCLLLTSTLEGCPNVALESQHLGVPVVATAGGGTVDAVLSGVTGILCGVNDAVNLTMGVRAILKNHAIRDSMGRAGREFVDACFAVDQMVDLTAKVYRMMETPLEQRQRVVTPKPTLREIADAPAGKKASTLARARVDACAIEVRRLGAMAGAQPSSVEVASAAMKP